MKKFLLIVLLLVILSACGKTPAAEPTYEHGKLTITFEYEKQSGYATNQFAVWIEDMDGNYIATVYATKFTANGGYKNRPDSIPTWVEKSGLANMTKSQVNAVAGATPKAGTVTYAWDLTNDHGIQVEPGEYRFFVEGSLRWKNRVVYSGVIQIGGMVATAVADIEFIYEGSDNQAALSSESSENSMIGAVTATYVPVE